jgi:hypothetical protein
VAAGIGDAWGLFQLAMLTHLQTQIFQTKKIAAFCGTDFNEYFFSTKLNSDIFGVLRFGASRIPAQTGGW